MSGSVNGFRYLEMVQKQKGKEPSVRDLSDYLSAKAAAAGVPLTGQFELTPLCNFSCKMCYVHLMKNQLGDQSILTVAQWKELMYQARQAGMLTASLSGGECLTYPGFEEIFLFLQELGCNVNVLTNGYIIDEKMVHFFQEHRPASVQITLYGCNDDVYERVTGKRAFSAVVDNIQKLTRAGINVHLTVTPNSYLGEDALETLRIAYNLSRNVRINQCLIKPREETGRIGIGDDAELDLYIKLYRLQAELEGKQPGEPFENDLPEAGGPCHECSERGLKCGGGRISFSMDWKGNITFCNSLDAVLYDALNEGFPNAWKKLNQAARNWPRVPECEGCAYKSVCIHCAAHDYQFAEPGKQPLALCERTKAFVRHGVWNIPVCE